MIKILVYNSDDHSPHIFPKELFKSLQNQEKLVLLDVREEYEFNLCKINGSVNLPLRILAQNLQKIDQDQLVVTICHHGVRSLIALEVLKQNGFTYVKNLKGGVDQWARDIDSTMLRY